MENSEITSSTNSEMGSSHWYRTLIARNKHIGEYLKSGKIPSQELLIIWGENLYEASNELLYGYEFINKKEK